MLIKVRKLGPTFSSPQVSTDADGTATLKADMIGELVRVPLIFRKRAELMVGELTMGFFPVGIEVELDDDPQNLNGLWVQRGVYDSLRNQDAAAA